MNRPLGCSLTERLPNNTDPLALKNLGANSRRRDSPNGKRYARKGKGIEEAFGFCLAPLLARAHKFEQAAERVVATER